MVDTHCVSGSSTAMKPMHLGKDDDDIPNPDTLLSEPANLLDHFGWLKFVKVFSVNSDSVYYTACSYVELHLSSQPYLLGDTPSSVDVALYATLQRTGERFDTFRQSNKYPNLVRVCSWVAAQYRLSLSLNITHPRDLPNAKFGEVCMRFALQPSPLFPITHARMAYWNHHFVRRYQGRLIIRFEDTDPVEDANDFMAKQLEAIETLGIKHDGVTYASDLFPQLMAMAETLIRKGKAYVDDTPKKQIEEQVMDGIESECRNNSLERNLELWGEMIAGSDLGCKCHLRAKIDMHNPTKRLRDPVYYYCNPVPHHRTGTRFKLYPTHAFATPFLDGAQTITHVLHSSHCRHLKGLYYRVLEDMELQTVQLSDYKKFNMAYTPQDSRQLRWFVDNGMVDGWDDPRLPTLQGLVRKGVTMEALKHFFYEKGVTKNIHLVEWDRLWAVNFQRIVAQGCPVHNAVLKQKCVLLTLDDGPGEVVRRYIPRHTLGEMCEYIKEAVTYPKRIWLECGDTSSLLPGKVIGLADWCNAEIKTRSEGVDGIITDLRGILVANSYLEPEEPTLRWLPETAEPIHLSLLKFDHLISKNKLGAGEDFRSVVSSCTKEETLALGDSDLCNLKHGDILMLSRKGFFRCDVPFIKYPQPIVLIEIPNGGAAFKPSW